MEDITVRLRVDTSELDRYVYGDRRARITRLVYRVFVVLMLIGLAAAHCSCLPTMPKVRSVDAQASAALIAVTSCGTSGSAVAVGPRVVLTAMHVIAKCPTGPVLLVDSTGEPRMAFAETATAVDVARLRLTDSEMSLDAKLPRTARVKKGDEVCIASGYYQERRCGRVKSVDESSPGGIDHTAPTIRGDSGSGVYDKRGRLVGIVINCNVADGGCAKTGGGATALGSRAYLAGEP